MTSHLQPPDSSSRKIPRAYFEFAKNWLQKSKGSPGPPPKGFSPLIVLGLALDTLLINYYQLNLKIKFSTRLDKTFYGD